MVDDKDLATAKVQSRLSDGIKYIIFDRPSKLNALTLADLEEIERLVSASTDHIRGLVFTGAGDRSFSVGMHTASFPGLDPSSARRFIRQVRDSVAAIRTSPLPTVAMINGYCLGVAFEIAIACDLRVSADRAQFGLPEVKVGIPSVIDTALLQQHIGLAMAKELILTGDLYSAPDLLRMGLLNRIAPSEHLEAETHSLLTRVTRHTATVLASQKRLFETWQNTGLQYGIEASIEEFARVFEAPETQQQVRDYRVALGHTFD